MNMDHVIKMMKNSWFWTLWRLDLSLQSPRNVMGRCLSQRLGHGNGDAKTGHAVVGNPSLLTTVFYSAFGSITM